MCVLGPEAYRIVVFVEETGIRSVGLLVVEKGETPAREVRGDARV